MPNIPRAVPSPRLSWLPAGKSTDDRDDAHRCANCFNSQFGRSSIPCKNHPRYNPRTGRLRPELGDTNG